MEPKSSKLHQQERPAAETFSRQPRALDFSTVDEVLRHDLEQTEPPAAIAHRLADSIAREGRPAQSWWRRIFRRTPPSAP
jgi:hypothetical protein